MSTTNKVAHGPAAQYQQHLQDSDFHYDPAQEAVVKALQARYLALHEQTGGWFSRLFSSKAVNGLYIWGDVGRGKTYLMDLFYDTLAVPKERLHFHRFMQRIHQALGQRAQQTDPLIEIAGNWAKQVKVLCFDEFYVSDIADAMLLGTLFTELFKRNVMLIATSNVEPDRLYWDGLQRAKFLPAIEQIKRHCEVIKLDSDTDYRLRILEHAEIYHYPHDEQAEQQLEGYFLQISPGNNHQSGQFDINGRSIAYRWRGDGVIWFDFMPLCGAATGTADYIEVARLFNTVLLSAVPRLDDTRADMTKRFIGLVDECYDRRVKLILSAQTPLADLYQGQRLAFEFKRTLSRLTEMQSMSYLAEAHLA